MAADSPNLHKAVEELLRTEEGYVRELQDICQVYIPCFRLLSSVSCEDEKTIFSNLQQILDLHTELSKSLMATDGDAGQIASCFMDRISRFDVYSEYCTKYHKANERLFELKQTNSCLSTIFADIQSSLGHPLPLSSYLHKPVQRVLKYHLLLKNMMELCNNSAKRALLEKAYLSLTDCAQRINNSKRLTEMDMKTRELHELILTIRESDHLGKLIREGDMTLRSGKSYSEAFLYLFENVLVICHKSKDVFSLHSIVRCSELVIIENCSKKEYEFCIIPFATPSKALTFAAKNVPQKIDWCIQMHKLTNHNIPQKARKLLIADSSFKEMEQGIFLNQSSSGARRSTAPLLSPRYLGKKLRHRLGMETLGAKWKSLSSFSLHTSSPSSTHHQQSVVQSPTQSYDAISFKSNSSCSSDLGSSILTEPEKTTPVVISFDDTSSRLRQLGGEFDRRALQNWHITLQRKIYGSIQSDNDSGPASDTPRHRSQSCPNLSYQPESTTTYRQQQLQLVDSKKHLRGSSSSLTKIKSIIHRARKWKKHPGPESVVSRPEKPWLGHSTSIDNNYNTNLGEDNSNYSTSARADSRYKCKADSKSLGSIGASSDIDLSFDEQFSDSFAIANLSAEFSQSLMDYMNNAFQVASG